MQCENGCGKFNTRKSKPVKRYFDDQGGKGAYADLCRECAISLYVIEEDETMIEKWKDENDFDSLEVWCTKVMHMLREYHTDKQHIGYLVMDDFEDVLRVMVENSELKIGLDENLYDTSNARNSNVNVIKYFVNDKLPYYEFDRGNDSSDSEHGFRLIFKLKEVVLQ